MEKIIISVTELAELLGIGTNQAYELCKTPGFPAIRIGRRYKIPRQGLDEWLRDQWKGPADANDL